MVEPVSRVAAWAVNAKAQSAIEVKSVMCFMKSAGRWLIVLRNVWRPCRKFRRGILRVLCNGLVDHAAVHGDQSVGGAAQVWLRFDLQKCRLLEQFAIETNMRVGPCPRRGAMQNVQLVRAIEFDLRLIERDHAA